MFPVSQWRHIASLLIKPLLQETCRRGLTIRSTGPIAAGRHLGYKSLAQMPARHNGPVSSNVRPHNHTAMLPTQLIEWSTWQNLDKYKSQELILLKGHLQIELFLGECLRTRLKLSENKIGSLSFSRRIRELGAVANKERKLRCALEYAEELNKLRNRLAHEAFVEKLDVDVLCWAKRVLVQMPSTKFQKRTNRTRITHAMAALAKTLYGAAHGEA